MVTRYADLIDAAGGNLAVAHARLLHPSPAPGPRPAHLADLGASLAHLAATIGSTGQPSQSLLTALRALARIDLDPAGPDHSDPRMVDLDLVEASTAIRVAADLIASHGPTEPAMTARQQAEEWASPRPAHLTNLPARQGVWTQIADLATVAADLTGAAPEPLVADAGARVRQAAAAVPRRPPAPAVQGSGPAWPLPLPRRAVPDEWAGRLEEVTALAWRMTRPPDAGRAHPIHALRLIAETGHLLHTQAARAAADPAAHQALRDRATLWRTLHRQLHALHTPTEPLMPAQQYALLRTRALAAAPLNPGDLRAGITTWTQAANWAPTTLAHAIGNPVVGLGPDLSPELRAHLSDALRAQSRPAREPSPHPYEPVLLANLNHRTASPVPAGALDPITELYAAATAPIHLPPPTTPPPPGPRLASVPTEAAAAATPTPGPGPHRGGAQR